MLGVLRFRGELVIVCVNGLDCINLMYAEWVLVVGVVGGLTFHGLLCRFDGLWLLE